MMLGSRALPPALFSLLLSVSCAGAAPYDFLDNYRQKSPAPADGPSASYHATRERDWLPYEVCGVVGGYLFTVLIWGVLLLTVGRKMRRKALDPPKALEVELQSKRPVRPTVKTPASPATSWFRKFKKSDSGVGTSPQSPDVQSPTSFDQKVLDADRERAQDDMERLYAAVMDHDAKKHSPSVSVDETQMPMQMQMPTPGRRRPSAISTTGFSQQNTPTIPISPITTTTTTTTTTPLHAPQPAPLRLRDTHQQSAPPPSPRGILSKRSQNPPSAKSTRFNLKNLRISGSSQKYPGAAPDDEARTPLSPRFHPSAPSPPTHTNSPITPYDPEEELDQVLPLPHPAPQRPAAPTITLSTTPTSTAPQQQHANSLPFRSYAEPLQSPGIQTTVLDRRLDKLSLTTPKTGVPYTPYSPYMPFTPVTPVTPHLVTKRERKVRQKGERGRRVGEEAQVKSAGEIFGDAY